MIRPTRLTMLLAGLILLTGCGSTQVGPREVSLGNALFQNVSGVFARKTAPPSAAALRSQITPELLDRIQGSVLLTEIGGAGALMAEDGRNGATVTYVDSGRVGLILSDGIMVGTRGLGSDLMTADVRATRAVLGKGGATTRIHRRMNGENGTVATTYKCQVSRDGNTVSESCLGPDDLFTNRYTLDASGRIAQSRQWIGPTSGYVTIQQIR